MQTHDVAREREGESLECCFFCIRLPLSQRLLLFPSCNSIESASYQKGKQLIHPIVVIDSTLYLRQSLSLSLRETNIDLFVSMGSCKGMFVRNDSQPHLFPHFTPEKKKRMRFVFLLRKGNFTNDTKKYTYSKYFTLQPQQHDIQNTHTLLFAMKIVLIFRVS